MLSAATNLSCPLIVLSVVAFVTKTFYHEQYVRSIISVFKHDLNETLFATSFGLRSNTSATLYSIRRELIHSNYAGQDNCIRPLSSVLSSTLQHSDDSILQSGRIPAAQSLLYKRPSVRSTSTGDRSRPAARWATAKSYRNRTRIM